MQTERSSTALLTLKFMSSIVKTQDELIKTYSSGAGAKESAEQSEGSSSATNDDEDQWRQDKHTAPPDRRWKCYRE